MGETGIKKNFLTEIPTEIPKKKLQIYLTVLLQN
jgi:hypothetical protein